jgi:hypothetical protein
MMNLNDMTAPELRKLAAKFNVTGRSTMKKAELVKALSAPELSNLLELHFGIIEAETEEREMNEIRAEIAAEAATIDAAIDRDVEAGTYSRTNEVAILRDAPGRAIVTAAFDGRTVGGSIVRRRNRYMLVAGTIKIKANSLEKVAKRFAQRLGFHADVIDIDQTVC